jgi:hypothetical protein
VGQPIAVAVAWERVASRRGANLLRPFLQRVRRLLAHRFIRRSAAPYRIERGVCQCDQHRLCAFYQKFLRFRQLGFQNDTQNLDERAGLEAMNSDSGPDSDPVTMGLLIFSLSFSSISDPMFFRERVRHRALPPSDLRPSALAARAC